MKPKLLITLGCSYTEGMGCYDFTNFPKNSNIFSNNVTKSQVDYQFTQFHEHGWPNKLGKLIGYDRVLNLGYGGASPSFNMKVFMQKYRNFNFSNWDVFLFWWIPQSHRFSFYKSKKVYNILPNQHSNDNDIENIIGKNYLNLIEYYPEDCILETNFYLGLMEDYCKLKGFNFLWFSEEWEYLIKNNLNSWVGLGGDELLRLPSAYENKSCHHPNELGYTIYAERFFEIIKTKHSNLITNPPNDTIEWEWNGKPTKNTIFNTLP